MLPPGNFHQLPTPCYIIDRDRFIMAIQKLQEAFDRSGYGFTIGYSVKTNSLPWLIKEAHRLGCHAEVVSADEYLLAKRCGIKPSNIIYNGPLKSKDTLMECFKNGGIINIETWRDIRWLEQYAKQSGHDTVRSVGIRVKMDLDRIAPSETSGTNDKSRFGFSEESGDLERAIESLRKAGIGINCIHMHRTTHSRGIKYYENAASYAVHIAQKYNLDLEYLDIGGGYWGIMDNKPTFQDYVDAITSRLAGTPLEGVHLIVEPGSAVTAWSMKLLSSVIDSKKISTEERNVTIDISRNDVDPFFRKTGYMTDVFYRPTHTERPIIPEQHIGGYTCLEDDRLLTIKDKPELRETDLLVFNRVGAYTMTLSGLFIRFFPPVFVYNEGQYTCVRRAWTENDIIIE